MPKVLSTDQIKNKIFFSLYKPETEIGEGSFGRVYSGHNIKTNEKVAFKFEPKNKSQEFLEQESCILFYLKGGKYYHNKYRRRNTHLLLLRILRQL